MEQNDLFSEEAKRDAALLTLEQWRKRWLVKIRREMRVLYLTRERQYGPGAFVTGDDARKYFEQLPNVPMDMSRNFLGAVFKNGDWKTDGRTIKSKTVGGHANRLFKWRYVGDLE